MNDSEQKDKDLSLSDKIEELESLLGQQDNAEEPETGPDTNTVPVLDELVTADDYAADEGTSDEKTADSSRDIDQLARKLEEKLSTELDEVVDALKGKLKNSIITELRTELSEQSGLQRQHDQSGSAKDEP